MNQVKPHYAAFYAYSPKGTSLGEIKEVKTPMAINPIPKWIDAVYNEKINHGPYAYTVFTAEPNMHKFHLGATDYIVACEVGGCTYYLTIKGDKFEAYWDKISE